VESRSKALARESGAKPPEAETLLLFGRLMDAANLSVFSRIWKQIKLDTVRVVFAENEV